jgi:hypothetical protein
MQRIDVNGRAIGTPFPSYRPPPQPDNIRRWASMTSAYPTPPGSGNAYARWFLDRIFPLDETVGDCTDSACLAAAPFLGDVVSVPGVMVGYRRHGDNDSNLLADYSRFPREVARARARWRFAQQVCGTEPIDERPLLRSRELLQLRVATQRVAPDEHPLPGDGWIRLARDTVRAPLQAGPESLRLRLLVAGWCLATLVAPPPLVRWLLWARYGRS